MSWAIGQRLQSGKYTIEQELGQGGFGITYLARDNNGRQVTIKTLNDKVQRRSDFAKFQQDFLNEALRLARCSHPHIVRINEVIQEDALWGIVMEYIDGENLASRVENQGALTESEALCYIKQIGEALIVVHDNGLLHRDVKPQNIMLRSANSEAVLIDFGIAREFTPNMTQTHTQMIADGFAPMEQYDRRAKRGAYTDVYAISATLYSLLTGEVPSHTLLIAAGTPLEPPKRINPKISNRVNQAILKGMEVKAENRPQSVQEWLALLDAGTSVDVNNISVAPPFSMIGTWAGRFSSSKATLVVTRQSGKSFDGFLIYQHWLNPARIKFTGNLDFEKRTLTIKETSRISGIWRLGGNQGTLSSDGNKITGTGQDRIEVYTWEFIKVK